MSRETIEDINDVISRLKRISDPKYAYFLIGYLDALRDLWLDGGDAADIAAEKFRDLRVQEGL